MASPRRAATPRTFPLLTLCVTGVTAVVSGIGLAVDPVLFALRRDAGAVSDGQLWRLLTALLVQDGGIAGTVFNLLGLLAVGTAAERRLGRRDWALAYLVGGVTGELVGWAGWQPVGAGNSVGVCGLAGAVALTVLRSADRPGRLESIAPATWAAALATATLTWWATVVAGLLTGTAARVGGLPAGVARWLLVALVAVPCAVLLAEHDIHGAALAAGLVIGTAVGEP